MTLRIIAAAPGATIQDGGRKGFLRYGVTPAGPMDWVAMRAANRALDNEADAAAVEMTSSLTILCEEAPVAVAFAGGAFTWTRDGAPLPGAARLQLQPGSVLRGIAGAWGAFAYLAVAGGLAVPPVMGSRSTHLRSTLGGVEGRMLAAGDRLKAEPTATAFVGEARFDAVWLERDDAPIRVILGPQEDHFTSEAIATFLRAPFTLTRLADRMAYRFTGPPIAHRAGFNIVSDGIALGAIQVSGDQQPMVMMADHQPTGGYPKIAHVCRADIGRLAQLRPGQTCRFHAIDVDAARAALLTLDDQVSRTAAICTPLRRVPSVEQLLKLNLVDGVVSAASLDPGDGA